MLKRDRNGKGKRITNLRLACAALACAFAPCQPALAEGASPWLGQPAEGFREGINRFSLSGGIGVGMSRFLTSTGAHDWWLAEAEYGRMIWGLKGEDRWYAGNFELIGQVFGGMQYSPSSAYLVGVAPLLRYNFAVGHRVVPFIDAGAGLSATDIRDGSLSTTFEFNLQAGVGAHVLLKDDLALTFQYRLIHLSNAGIDSPNAGVNTGTFMAGVSWFF